MNDLLGHIFSIDQFLKWHPWITEPLKKGLWPRRKKTVKLKAADDFCDKSKRLTCQLTGFISGISLMCLESRKEDGFYDGLLACASQSPHIQRNLLYDSEQFTM